MTDRLSRTVGLLSELVSFPSVSGEPNLDIVDHVRAYLDDHGVASRLSYDESGDKANLFATIGPEVDGGVVLSGHTDVVPAEPRDWDTPPYTLVNRDGRLTGRGAVDMKGFIACVLAGVPEFARAGLRRPVHIALTFDEETGSRGARLLAEEMRGHPVRPAYAIVGEPTAMRIVAGHKGGYELTTTVLGTDGHASQPARGVNAIFYAARMIGELERVGAALAREPRESPFDPPHSTISVGTVYGGAARNVIARNCAFDWELRPMPGEDAEAILADIEAWVRRELVPAMRRVAPAADIATVLDAAYPGLAYDSASPAVALLRALTGANDVGVVSFGSDAGHFQRAGLSTVVFGPGSIDQAHKPNEFIAVDQLEACNGFLDRLRDWLSEERPG